MVKINLKEESEEYVCTCGASSNLPNCDGSHNSKNKEENANYKPILLCSKSEVELEVDSGNWKK